MKKKRIEEVAAALSRELSSVIELLEGRTNEAVMARVTHPDEGLFPKRNEIRFGCSCPDGARVCKHVAAVFYGIGVRLDAKPELFFELRGVIPQTLVDGVSLGSAEVASERRLDGDLSEIFGVLIVDELPRGGGSSKTAARGSRTSSPWSRRKIITRAELIEAGIPAGTVSGWLRAGHLEPTSTRGRYRLTPKARSLLAGRR